MSLRSLFIQPTNSVNNQLALRPIVRSTPEARIQAFLNNENYLYNKYSVYSQNIGTSGPNQPYVYVSITDSTQIKDLTRYDTQETPAGSVERDETRISKFLSSGTGQLFKNRQVLFQKQNAFSETIEYDQSSILSAVIAPSTKDPRPVRHIENSTSDTIEGSATGDGAPPYSAYAGQRGNAKYGLLRFATGNKAISNFNTLWGQGSVGGGSGGSQAPYVSRLQSTAPTNTDPYGQNSWKFRPEYNTSDEAGIYFSFLSDRFGLMTVSNTSNTKTFYNDPEVTEDPKTVPVDFHKYTPGQTQTVYGANADDKTNYYASSEKIIDGTTGTNNLEALYQRMLEAITNQTAATPQFRKSAEGYVNDPDKGVSELNNYQAIPQTAQGPFIDYLRNSGEASVQVDEVGINSKGFAKASRKINETGKADSYNKLLPLRDTEKNKLYLEAGSNQSKDLIFFYFYDLINKVYIPFRAVLGSIQDSHSPDWTDIKYMGRADTLYVYKGFSRDVSFNFRVYANSIEELIPMWKRINHFVGLARPSKYTDRAFVTANSSQQQPNAEGGSTLTVNAPQEAPQQTSTLRIYTQAEISQGTTSQAGAAASATSTLRIQTNQELVDRIFAENAESTLRIQTNQALVDELYAEETEGSGTDSLETTGLESGFIYPPMIEFRIGDLYVDQPAVLKSIGTSIPEDAHWETLRDDTYKYIYGQTDEKVINKDARSRQLPTIVDISVQLSIIERDKSITTGNHFGPMVGWENTLA